MSDTRKISVNIPTELFERLRRQVGHQLAKGQESSTSAIVVEAVEAHVARAERRQEKAREPS